MTHLEKIDYLGRYQKMDLCINRKIEEIDFWRDKALSVTGGMSAMPKGGGYGDKTGDCVGKIVDLQQEINEDIDRLVDLRVKIKSAIEAVTEESLQFLLECRYIDGMTWEAIAEKMIYSYQHISRLHKKAIEKVWIADEE